MATSVYTIASIVPRRCWKGKRFRYGWNIGGLTVTLTQLSATRRQTTLSARLSQLLNVPHISLDTLHWGPNWSAYPAEEFRAKVQEKLDENAETGWVIDGSYFSKLRTLVSDNATDIICKFVEYEGALSPSISLGF